jgi:endonuclease YncB( thermonuclease family)
LTRASQGRALFFVFYVLVLLVLVAQFSAVSAGVPSLVFWARVVGVTDGDTVTVLAGGQRRLKIRLAEIDAPEHDQPWGKQSKQALSKLYVVRTFETGGVRI